MRSTDNKKTNGRNKTKTKKLNVCMFHGKRFNVAYTIDYHGLFLCIHNVHRCLIIMVTGKEAREEYIYIDLTKRKQFNGKKSDFLFHFFCNCHYQT